MGLDKWPRFRFLATAIPEVCLTIGRMQESAPLRRATIEVCLLALALGGCASSLELAPPAPPAAYWNPGPQIEAAWNEGVWEAAGLARPLPAAAFGAEPRFYLPGFSRIAFLPGLRAGGSASSAGSEGQGQKKEFGPAERGAASWYAEGWAWKKTAAGEIYDPQSFTAAHQSLPFNSVVRVTNLETGRSILVRINNRGPFVKGRIIDVSPAAAKALGFYNAGVAQVDVVRVQ